MSQYQYTATALSRKSIRDYVNYLKVITGTSSVLRIDILKFLENDLYKIMPDLDVEIVEKHKMVGKYAETFPSRRIVRIREDVYDRAVKGYARDRFTVAHESGHLLLHDNESISLCRIDMNVTIPAYLDPEWQANVFAGEFLANVNLISGMSTEQVSESCGVSMQTAEIQLKFAK